MIWLRKSRRLHCLGFWFARRLRPQLPSFLSYLVTRISRPQLSSLLAPPPEVPKLCRRSCQCCPKTCPLAYSSCNTCQWGSPVRLRDDSTISARFQCEKPLMET